MDSSHAWEESITHKQNKQYSTFFFSDICKTVIQMYIEKIKVAIMYGNSVSTFGNLVQIFIIFKTWLLLISGEIDYRYINTNYYWNVWIISRIYFYKEFIRKPDMTSNDYYKAN